MKKLFSVLTLSALFVFTGCSDFFIDATAVHNGLVDRMDATLSAEETFYDTYYNIQEGDDTAVLVTNYTTFKDAAAELESYITDTKFASTQQVFIAEYNDYYKPEVQKYVDGAGKFVDTIKANGFVLAEAEKSFEEMDGYGQKFVEVHNKLIDTINAQADY